MPQESINQKLAQAVTRIKSEIETGNFPNNRQLVEVSKEHYINLIDVKNESHRLHDILETAVNLYLFEKYDSTAKENKYETLTVLENLAQRLPTHT